MYYIILLVIIFILYYYYYCKINEPIVILSNEVMYKKLMTNLNKNKEKMTKGKLQQQHLNIEETEKTTEIMETKPLMKLNDLLEKNI